MLQPSLMHGIYGRWLLRGARDIRVTAVVPPPRPVYVLKGREVIGEDTKVEQ